MKSFCEITLCRDLTSPTAERRRIGLITIEVDEVDSPGDGPLLAALFADLPEIITSRVTELFGVHDSIQITRWPP